MAKKITADFKGYWTLVISAIMLCLTLVAACAQRSAQTSPTSQTQNPSPSQVQNASSHQPAKIKLNEEEMGTTSDTTKLSQKLKDIFRQREEQFVMRDDKTGIEKTVFIRAEHSLKLNEVTNVIGIVGVAGASPIKLPVEADEKAGNANPHPLTLVVDIGNPSAEMPLTGIVFRYFPDFMPDRSTLKNYVTVEIPRDGEYFIDGKKVEKSALSGELQTRLKTSWDYKRVIALVAVDANVSYSSLAEVANAAFEAHADVLQLATLAH